VFIGTPWTYNDVLSYVAATGEFGVMKTPVYVDAEEGDAGAVYYEEMGQWVTLTWPEVFDLEEIEKARKRSGTLEFARMFLLNLDAAKGINLKPEWLHEYPVEDIKNDWPVYVGIDFASTRDKLKDKKRDYFAMAWVRVIPGGGVIVQDGYMEKMSQGEAEQKSKAICESFLTLQGVAIETAGKGELFHNAMLLNTVLPVVGDTGQNKSKGQKFEIEMAPHFEFGRVWISNADTPFLKAFRAQWLLWPNAPHDDALDAVYYALRLAAPHLWVPVDRQKALVRKKKKTNPWTALAGVRG